MHDKNENIKDEAYYTHKIEELRKSKGIGKTLIVEEDSYDSDERVEVWSTNFEDEEVQKPTHGKGFVVKEDKSCVGGKCLMVRSTNFESQEYFTDEGAKSKVCYVTKSVKENARECENVINKVHSIHKSLNIPVTRYDFELTELCATVSNLSECIKRSCIKNSDHDDSFSRETFRSEERMMKIESLNIEITRLQDDVIILKRDNRLLTKQLNIFL